MRGAVLIIHSERRYRDAARAALELAGHAAAEAVDLASAWRQAEAVKPDLILLPWTARKAVREAIHRVREAEATGQARVLVWANQPDMHDAIGALELGADDCLTLPFDHAELVARVNACLRRPASRGPTERIAAGPLVLDKAVHTVMVREERVELAPTEFRLMAFFLENQGRVFSREELLRRAWSRNIQAGQRTVDVHVRRLRQLLEPFGCDDMIQTVRGFGYRFSPPAREARGALNVRVVERPDVA
jgi:two-component system, OmpR family, phosphate regulon response regulator PhoB